jgi:hypothetical protein
MTQWQAKVARSLFGAESAVLVRRLRGSGSVLALQSDTLGQSDVAEAALWKRRAAAILALPLVAREL